MKTLHSTLLGTSLFAILSATTHAANFDNAIENALKFGEAGKYGQIKLDLRYRYENVHVDTSVKNDASANTLRLRLGYLTPEIYKFQSYIFLFDYQVLSYKLHQE